MLATKRMVLRLVFGAVVASLPMMAGVVFSDQTFNLGDYTATPSLQSNGTITGAQCTSCGNPGDALQFTESITGVSLNVDLGYVNNSFSYDPLTQGAILSIAASVDKNLTIDPFTSIISTFHPVIEQGGFTMWGRSPARA